MKQLLKKIEATYIIQIWLIIHNSEFWISVYYEKKTKKNKNQNERTTVASWKQNMPTTSVQTKKNLKYFNEKHNQWFLTFKKCKQVFFSGFLYFFFLAFWGVFMGFF